MSATQHHCHNILAAAKAQNSPSVKVATTAALRDLNKAELRALVGKLAWTAGCLARRLPDDGEQVMAELEAADRRWSVKS